jgi:hypothetical protein
MAQVFTSYSRRDTETVDRIVGKMTQAGISVWIDREAIKAYYHSPLSILPHHISRQIPIDISAKASREEI